MAGFKKREESKTYTPQEGDTLETIAQRETEAGNPITAAEIARYNWGTDDTDVINELLRDELGCYRRDGSKNFVISEDADGEGELCIPERFSQQGLGLETTHEVRVRKKAPPPPQFQDCIAIEGITFGYDMSFVRPSVVGALQALEDAIAKHPDAKVMIFGHTDKVGSDTYNKALSERRAESVYAFITDDAAAWERLYGDENWGQPVLSEILADIDPKYDPAQAGGFNAAVRAYQGDRGLVDDGIAGPKTREKLFTEYMTSKHDVELTPDQFMAPKFMGCGEYNPVEDTEAASEPNRRVMFYLFHPDRLPKLPCALGDTGPCQKQMVEDDPRHTETFRCSFYDSIAKKCNCEKGSTKPITTEGWPITIRGQLFWNRTWDYNDYDTPLGSPVKEMLPGSKVELRIQKAGATDLSVHETDFLTDDGKFVFTDVPECTKAAIRILLEHRDSKVVRVKGMSNAASDPDFEVKTGKVVWHQMDLDDTQLDGKTEDLDLGEVEITHADFVGICDAYKTVWFGHEQLKTLADHDLPVCQINYPESGTSNASAEMQLNSQDTKDRDVILHEYGHFIGHHVLGGLPHAGYTYNDEPPPGGHARNTKEHYESAWVEGHATFLACALADDPHYHDGYDTDLNYHLDSDNTTIGPHAEGSIQEALWRIYKVHGTDFKTGFWKAFSDKSKRKASTIYAFYDNWKDLGLSDLDKVVESFKKFGMEYGYRYRDGSERFKAVAATEAFDEAKKEFTDISELFDQFGKLGSGTEKQYKEEFYNRNKEFNSGALGAGSTPADPKISVGKSYIVPVRFQVTS